MCYNQCNYKPDKITPTSNYHVGQKNYFTFFIKRKTGNQLNICLVHLLADEKEYTDDTFVMVLSQKD